LSDPTRRNDTTEPRFWQSDWGAVGTDRVCLFSELRSGRGARYTTSRATILQPGSGQALGSTSLLTNVSGGEVGRQKYYPYGAARTPNPSTLLTDYRFTGQRSEEANLGSLYDYGARFYSPLLGRFLSPDSIVPAPGDPQSLNRYAYTRSNPLNRVDPSGHADVPPISELMQQAIKFFTDNGWQSVGDPSKISPNWNGADLVFTMREGGRTLTVELKDIAGKVNLGTLGWSEKGQDYGGSIDRVARSAARFAKSSADQLRLMSQTVRTAKEAGTLENALFASAEGVTDKAQAQFGGVYRTTRDGQVIVEKALAEVKQSGLMEKAAAGASALTVAKDVAVTAATALGSQPFAIPAPLIMPRAVFEDFMQRSNMYGTIQN
jgi:RHS repeat-associated protein